MTSHADRAGEADDGLVRGGSGDVLAFAHTWLDADEGAAGPEMGKSTDDGLYDSASYARGCLLCVFPLLRTLWGVVCWEL
jgi:hypothetical protein